MPVIHSYRVQETREVMVTANNPTDAVRIGSAAFESGQNSDNGANSTPVGIWGNTDTAIRTVEISAYEVS